MKKFVSVIFVFFNLYFFWYCCFPAKVSAEETQYARILNQTTYLYNSADTSSPCFLIPETYYVKLIREDTDYYFVEYQEDFVECQNGLELHYKSISGYCKKTDLYLCDYIPDNPYLRYKITVYDGAKGYKSSSLSKVDYLFNSGNPIIYYGKYKINNVLFYYVLAHGEYRCYISSSECKELAYTLNADPLPINEEEPVITPEVTTPETISDTSGKLKIALILILVVPALIATAFLFKPQKKKVEKDKYFYDENDYE